MELTIQSAMHACTHVVVVGVVVVVVNVMVFYHVQMIILTAHRIHSF